MTDVIENAQAYRTGKLPVEKVGVKAKDNFTLLVKLNSPVSYFLSMIEYVIFAPLPEHLIEKLKVEKKEDQWTKPENIVVSGPFSIVCLHTLYMKKPFLKGFWRNLLYRHEWKYMWIDEKWDENQKEEISDQFRFFEQPPSW